MYIYLTAAMKTFFEITSVTAALSIVVPVLMLTSRQRKQAHAMKIESDIDIRKA